MPFIDRADAAAQLARALAGHAGKRPLVLAVPRGAVPMGAIIADALSADLDVVLVRKLGAPGNPEFAIGAVDETGWTYLTPYATVAGADSAYIDRERAAQLDLLRQRRAAYTPGRDPLCATGRQVIVVDDGLATGASMIAALHAIREQKPARIICAVPVAPPQTLALLQPYADEVVCLESPDRFRAVGDFYRDFSQVKDAEVVACLAGR
ncbi:phosphoribosyltransferase [Cupriavidus basilensis]|uniref:Protein-L-isoaspartate O-methyltransferase n=1 Tax=Cupriavidus basilensis TaxID=68895 RepID=A0A0C4Y3G1_9BURK|nr:phosphoribosyltransferase family protein [Cupriavidus basilensis]AJG19732.1 Protein-L-isoaspartate O-methyltransferase [Cupriavidus basilensis]